MQWYRAKTILIVVFLCINIFLGIYLITDRYQNESRALSELVNVLSANQIHLRVDSLPKVPPQVLVPEFFGAPLSEKTIKLLVPNFLPKENGYTNAEGSISLEQTGNRILYQNPTPNQKGFRKVNENNVISKLRPYVEALGVEKYVYPVNVSRIQDDIMVEYAYRVDSTKLYGSSLRISVSTDGIRQIRGFLGVPDRKNGFSYRLSKLETVLMGLAQMGYEGIEITAVKLGYYFIDYTDAMVSQAIPVYQIRTSAGELILDGRDGVENAQRLLSEQ